MNPIQQAISALEDLLTSEDFAQAERYAREVLTSLRSLQKEVEGVGLLPLPEPHTELYKDLTPVLYEAWSQQLHAYARTAIAVALGRGVVPQDSVTMPRFDCWSTNDGDSWYEHPADAQIIEDVFGGEVPKVGDEFDVLAGWTSVMARYRVTHVNEDGECEVECISHPEATQPTQAITRQTKYGEATAHFPVLPACPMCKSHTAGECYEKGCGYMATQPTQAEPMLIHGVPVHGLLPVDREPMEAIVKAAYEHAKKVRGQPTQTEARPPSYALEPETIAELQAIIAQAEAPSERGAREMQEVADKLREAGYHSAANNTERTIADIKSGNIPSAVIGAALATQQAGQGEPVGMPLPCDITVGHVTMSKGVSLRSLVFRMQALYELAQEAATPPAPQQSNIPKELDVRTILLDVVPGDGDGLEVYATSVADVEAKLCKMGEELEDWQLGIRRYVPEQQPEALAQQERDREDAENYRWLCEAVGTSDESKRDRVLRAMEKACALPKTPQEFDAAIRAARSSEGGAA